MQRTNWVAWGETPIRQPRWASNYRSEQSDVGAGYVAKELCSCIFVGERDLASCRDDIPPTMERVQAEAGDDRVRAFVPGLAERIARNEPPSGCVLY